MEPGMFFMTESILVSEEKTCYNEGNVQMFL